MNGDHFNVLLPVDVTVLARPIKAAFLNIARGRPPREINTFFQPSHNSFSLVLKNIYFFSAHYHLGRHLCSLESPLGAVTNIIR